MSINWNVKRTPKTINVPDKEREKTPEMQFRRELTFSFQETAFSRALQLYGTVALEAIKDEADKKILTNLLPEAKAAILVGMPIGDALQRMWCRVPGISMKQFASFTTSHVECTLLDLAELFELRGYKTAIKQLPIIPTNQYTRLFELAGMGFTGKNHMVVTRKFGCKVNMGIIATDAPLLHGDYRYAPYSQNQCGDCTLCEEYCPSGALQNGKYDPDKCHAYINAKENQIQFSEHAYLHCDACMRVCPLGEIEWDSKPVAWPTILEKKQINW